MSPIPALAAEPTPEPESSTATQSPGAQFSAAAAFKYTSGAGLKLGGREGKGVRGAKDVKKPELRGSEQCPPPPPPLSEPKQKTDDTSVRREGEIRAESPKNGFSRNDTYRGGSKSDSPE